MAKLSPLPSGDQPVPSHLATPPRGVEPANVNSPPAYSVVPVPSSNDESARALWLSPLPSQDHPAPSHFANPCALFPPALEKLPPAYSAGPPPSSNAARA